MDLAPAFQTTYQTLLEAAHNEMQHEPKSQERLRKGWIARLDAKQSSMLGSVATAAAMGVVVEREEGIEREIADTLDRECTRLNASSLINTTEGRTTGATTSTALTNVGVHTEEVITIEVDDGNAVSERLPNRNGRQDAIALEDQSAGDADCIQCAVRRRKQRDLLPCQSTGGACTSCARSRKACSKATQGKASTRRQTQQDALTPESALKRDTSIGQATLLQFWTNLSTETAGERPDKAGVDIEDDDEVILTRGTSAPKFPDATYTRNDDRHNEKDGGRNPARATAMVIDITSKESTDAQTSDEGESSDSIFEVRPQEKRRPVAKTRVKSSAGECNQCTERRMRQKDLPPCESTGGACTTCARVKSACSNSKQRKAMTRHRPGTGNTSVRGFAKKRRLSHGQIITPRQKLSRRTERTGAAVMVIGDSEDDGGSGNHKDIDQGGVQYTKHVPREKGGTGQSERVSKGATRKRELETIHRDLELSQKELTRLSCRFESLCNSMGK